MLIVLISPLLASLPNPSTDYLALWQMQLVLATVAVPLLAFIIQMSTSEPSLRLPVVEVLLRYTYVFPIFVFVVVGVGLLTVAVLVERTGAYFAAALALFLVSLVLTTVSYARLLHLMSRKTLRQEKSEDFLIQRYREALWESTNQRIGVAILQVWLDANGVAYASSGFVDSERYLPLRIEGAGYMADIHLGRLLDFLSLLPWRDRVEVQEEGDVPIPRQIEEERPRVILSQLLGEEFSATGAELLWLRRDALKYETPATWESRMVGAFRIGDS